MKLSSKTKDILKNFTEINQQLLIQPGKRLRIQSAQGDFLAYADVEEEFTEECGIHDLSKFVGIVTLFTEPSVTFTSKVISIFTDRQRVNYTCAPKEMIKDPLIDEVDFDGSVTFTISAVDLSKTLKAMKMLGHTDLVFKGRDGVLSMDGTNPKNPTEDTFSLIIGETDKTFRVLVPHDRLKLMTRDYKVTLSNDCGVRFVADELTYFVAYTADAETDVGDI